ncbi:MAG: PhzF family phenazine biosynthesis protein [Anaerolineae bacterium]
MSNPIFQVDAFTHIPYRGNPAAVVVLTKMPTDEWLQKVAAEMNLSETAFVAPNADPFKRIWQLRWFTPKTEVELCGHATIATAHVMFSEGYAKPFETIRFDTLSGELQASKDSAGWIKLDFPTSRLEPVGIPPNLAEVLGAQPISLSKAFFDEEFDFLIELESMDAVKTLQPDILGIKALGGRAVTVTAPGAESAEGSPDFVSRVFAPNAGVDEDPVTGSAHCYLSKFWADKLGKDQFRAHQVSKRGGTLDIILKGEHTIIAGRAVTILKGSLLK